MKTFQLASAALASVLLLASCGKESPTPPVATPATPATATAKGKGEAGAVSVAAIEAEGKGFTVGSPMSVRTVYVFFDAQCPHCGALWESAKPLKSQAKFIWMPVSLLNPQSTSQGAAILAAKDPVATMDAHEVSLMAKQGGMTVTGDNDAQKAIVAQNTKLFNRFGFASIPTIVATNAQTGALVSREGALGTPELAALLGLQAPTGK
ncbi:MAG: thioredoxin fold domain-containing protein [Ramlibacter sp.]